MANNLRTIGRIMDYRLVLFKGQTILSLLVVALVVQWRLFGDEVRPVHLPRKKEEGTVLPPGEPYRPFPVGSLV